MSSVLPFNVQQCSGEDAEFPAAELNVSSAQSRGWRTALLEFHLGYHRAYLRLRGAPPGTRATRTASQRPRTRYVTDVDRNGP